MAKKTIYPGARGRINKFLERPIDLTGINKISWANVQWAKVRLAFVEEIKD